MFSDYKGRLISFTSAFRLAFLVLALAALLCIIATAAGLYEPTNRTMEEGAAPCQGAPAAEAQNSPSPPKP